MSTQRKKSSNTYSSEYKPAGSDKIISIRYYVGGALIFLFALGAAYSCFKFSKATEFSAKMIYEEVFVEPASEIIDLDGNRSNSLVGFDSWIRFKNPGTATLRNAREFKSDLPEVGRSLFSEKYPLDSTLRCPPNEYEYKVRAESGVGKVINEGLLIHKNTREYFYRRWGM